MDWRVVKFLTDYQYQQANQKLSVAEKTEIIHQAIKNNQALKITYLRTNDEKSERVIEPLEMGKFSYLNKEFIGLRAFCQMRQVERMFRLDRILKISKTPQNPT